MPGPFPLASLAPTIDAAGISAPPFEDILASLQASYRGIYGADVDLAPDTQDGGWIAYMASLQDDVNQKIIATYNAYSPQTAQGAGLSSVVKINSIRRQSSTFSTAPLLLIGQAGTFIASGICLDDFGNQWTLPPNTVIPDSGTITVTGTCATPGAIAAAAGTITQIVTIVPGWQSVSNVADAAPGDPVETDAALRQRQTISTGLPAQTPLQAILGAVANVAGVTRYAIYENSTSHTDANGVPSHSVSVIAEGGDIGTIAQVISEKKAPGAGTYGTTSELVIDPAGIPGTINFFVLSVVQIYLAIWIRPLTGYVSTTGQLIVAAVQAAIANLSIGVNVYYNRLFSAANLSGGAALSVGAGRTQSQLDLLSSTYEVTAIYVGLAPGPTGTGDIILTFNEAAGCDPGNVTLVIPPP